MRLAVDTETTGLSPWHGDAPFGVGLCWEDGETEYYSWPVDPFTREVRWEEDEGWERVRDLVSDPAQDLVFFHAEFDIRMLEAGLGIETRGRFEEAIFAAHACNSLEPSWKLKDLSKHYLQIGDADEKQLQSATVRARRQGKKAGWKLGPAVQSDYWMVELAEPGAGLCEEYCQLDAERTMLLWLMYEPLLDSLDVRQVYENELLLWDVTHRMRDRGVRLDRGVARKQLKESLRRARRAQKRMDEMAGRVINPDAPADLREVLFDTRGLEVVEYTPKAHLPATNTTVLKHYMDDEFVQQLVAFRAASKGASTFYQKFLDLSVPDPLTGGETYALHADFTQVGPCTGRFSCRNPNLQNVANALTTRSEEPIQARTAFGPRPGYTWYHFDYEQLEVRIFADVAQEVTMLDAIAHGRDLHTECTNKAWGGEGNPAAIREAIHSLELRAGEASTARVREVWGEIGFEPGDDAHQVAVDWLTLYDWDIVVAEKTLAKKTARAKAKMILFAKLFGGGPNAIKDLLNCSRGEAEQFLADYDTAFPAITRYISDLSDQAANEGFIRTRFGRRLTVLGDKAYRAVNYMVQGSAADLLKLAMRKVDAYLQRTGLDAHIVLSIHDEIAIEVAQKDAYLWLLRGVRNLMEDHEGYFSIPMPVDADRVRVRWDQPERVGSL